MKSWEVVERNLRRSAGARLARKNMKRRERAVGRKIYKTPKQRQTAIRARFKKALQKKSK